MVTVEIKKVKLDEIRLNPDNPRTITKQAMARLVKSLQDFPEMMEIREVVVDETMTCLGGNMRTIALRKAGAKTATAKIVSGLTAEQKREFVIKDNTNFGDFNLDDLANSWSDLPLADWGLSLPEDWLKGPAADPSDAEPQIDRAEELNKAWKVKAGDLWQIGEHRLLCGDSTKKEDVARVMAGEKAGAIIADPPYGMRLDADFSGMKGNLRSGRKQGNKYADVIGDHNDFNAAPVIAAIGDPAIQFWFGADYYSKSLPDAEHSGAWLVWDKRLDESADKMFGSCFELIWARQKCKRDIIRIKWAGIFGTEKGTERARQHPNQKPVELLVNLANRTEGIIIDPFTGSGTCLVACQNLNRKCMGIEISEAYCSVILQRMQDAFGITGERMV
ncbi:MAG: DNA methyltransferase [Pseudomonadota bacterium]